MAIAAKADDGDTCASYMGPGGAGHYVKMVHNGIEYGDMQLIAESYDLLHRGAGCSVRELAAIFRAWNETELRSYLLEITIRVLEQIDTATGEPLLDSILDEADQKGTGKWMSQNAFDIGGPGALHCVKSAYDTTVTDSRRRSHGFSGTRRVGLQTRSWGRAVPQSAVVHHSCQRR
jgi:6-phosphogluconate dehydrogenase